MKIIIKHLAFGILLTLGCKKEMITHPEYSFLRLNEEIEVSCYTQSEECIDIQSMSDLQFQLITDFTPITEEGILTSVIVVPCNGGCPYTAEEIYDELYGGTSYEVTAVFSYAVTDDGELRVANLNEPMTNINIGDIVNFYNGETNLSGVYEVINKEVAGSGTLLTFAANGQLFTDFPTSPYARVTKISSSFPAYIFTNTFTIADDSVFVNSVYEFGVASVNGVLPYTTPQCFSFCVYSLTMQHNEDEAPTFLDGECFGTTNCFQKTDDECYTTKLIYGCNESAFGFYTDGTNPFQLAIRLPLWFYAPKYPGEENGYQRSDGQFVKLSERINKTWEMETDYFPEQIHERLRIALSCDNITVTNENAQMTDVDIYRNAEYSIEWNDDVKNYPFAKGKTTVFKQLLSRSINSNCA